MASRNAPLCRQRLNSFSESDMSQLDAPLSCARSMALYSAAGASSLMDDTEALLLLSHSRRTVLFVIVCASIQSKGYSNSCSLIGSQSGKEMDFEATMDATVLCFACGSVSSWASDRKKLSSQASLHIASSTRFSAITLCCVYVLFTIRNAEGKIYTHTRKRQKRQKKQTNMLNIQSINNKNRDKNTVIQRWQHYTLFTRSTAAGILMGYPHEDLAPRIDWMAEHNNEKPSWHCNQHKVLL